MAAMNPSDIPLFQMLRSRLGYLSERQKTIAQNVANSDTAGYAAQDLKAFSFDVKMQAQKVGMAMSVTAPGHIAPPSQKTGLGAQWKPVRTPDSETTLNGNSVVLEEEMIKMGEARTNYDAAISFYQKSLGLIRLATRRPGSA
jgi:flagellar basal-body rod protein FlgB